MKVCITLLLFFFSYTLAAQRGGVKLKIKDEQAFNLPGASVAVSPGNYCGTTNQNGELILTGMAPGDYTITVSYIGFETTETPVVIGNKLQEIQTVLKFRSALGQEVVVATDRLPGQARALNQQRNNLNLSNVISADQIGRFPDANIGDAIKRVPGVTMQNDQGEARNIIIRGMGPELNAVSLNGERIPSAEGDNRRVQMDLIPSDMIQTVVVNKTLTADMDADAIGGSVNLITRAPLNGLRISGTLAGGFNPVRNGFIGTANFVAGNRFANNQLGVVVSGSFNTNDYGSDNVEAVWNKDANGKLYIADHDIRTYDIKRVRRALATTLDYKINPKNTIYLTASYNWRDDLENRFRLRHRLRGDAEDLIYDATGTITGYSNGEVIRQTKGGINNNRNEGTRLEDQRVRTLALRGEHVVRKLAIDWSGQYARASEVRPNERYIAMGQRSITINQDISDTELPLLTDATPLANYTRLGELTEQFQHQYEEDFNAKLNFEIPVSLIKTQKGALKFGGRLRAKIKDRSNTFFSYEPIDDNESKFENITLLPLLDKTNGGFYAGSKFRTGQFIDARFLGDLTLKNAAAFEESDEPAEYLAGNYNAKETITAGYVQLTQKLSQKLTAVAGLRMEHTAINYTGNIVQDEDELKGEATLKNNYTDFLPGINLRYEGLKNLIVRAAWTNALARPQYYDLVPYFNINPNDFLISSGNPALKPIRSTNLDLMAEKYFKSIGIVSGGVFYKHLNNFFYSYRDDQYTSDEFSRDFPDVENPIAVGDQYEFIQPRNGDDVDVYGFEVAVQRQLDFLPSFWKGFGVYANYTYTKSKASGIFDLEGNKIRENVTLPGTAPHLFNASLSFETKKITARLSGNFTAAYIDDSDDAGYNEDPFFDRYYDKQFFLDANATYAVTPKLRVFGEANNLTNQPLRYYQGVKERTAQLEYYGPRYNFGLKFDLNR